MTSFPPHARGAETYGIVVFSHLRWNFVWQRPQQFLSRFAAHHPVLFMELTDFDLPEGELPRLDVTTVAPNVTVANLHLPASFLGTEAVNDLMREACRTAIDKINVDGAFNNPLLWFYSPMDAAWALPGIAGCGIVYDCMDELSQFKGADPRLVSREQMLLKAADIVFTGGYELYASKKRHHSNVHCFGCGVEYSHFSRAQNDEPLPADLAEIKGPIAGWFGVIDERMDYDLVRELAALRPDINFVFVGPVVKVDPEILPKASNIHWLGGRDYQVLPDYCRGFDVCIMPFALNEATEYINPTKALEYLATGRPVVSTPVRDVVRQYADTIQIAGTSKEFADAIDRGLKGQVAEMSELGRQQAQLSSWESTVKCMRDLIAEAICPYRDVPMMPSSVGLGMSSRRGLSDSAVVL